MFKVNPETYTIEIVKGDIGYLPIQLRDAYGKVREIDETTDDEGFKEELVINFFMSEVESEWQKTVESQSAEWKKVEDNQIGTYYYYPFVRHTEDTVGSYRYSVELRKVKREGGKIIEVQWCNTIIPLSLYKILPNGKKLAADLE